MEAISLQIDGMSTPKMRENIDGMYTSKMRENAEEHFLSVSFIVAEMRTGEKMRENVNKYFFPLSFIIHEMRISIMRENIPEMGISIMRENIDEMRTGEKMREYAKTYFSAISFTVAACLTNSKFMINGRCSSKMRKNTEKHFPAISFIIDEKRTGKKMKENINGRCSSKMRENTEKHFPSISFIIDEMRTGEKMRENILSEARNNEDGEGRKKFNVEKQMGSDSPLFSYHISGLLKHTCLFLISLSLPCAGGTGLEDRNWIIQQQAVSGIYEHTVSTVTHCPRVSEYTWRASEKCGEVCGTDMQNEICKYHCMRDSYKTSIVEFCAKPKILFVYCPMYDPIGRTIQMDLSTLCDPSNSSKIHFISSDVFFCDPDNCLRLREAAVSTVESMIETTTSSGGINGGWLSQYRYILVFIGCVVVLFVVVGCIFRLPKRLAVFFRKLMRKKNPDDKQAEVKSMLSGNAV